MTRASAAMWVIGALAAACGASGVEGGAGAERPAPELAAPEGPRLVADTPAAAPEPEAPVTPPPVADPLAACRVLEAAAGAAVDVRAAPVVRLRPRRVGPRAGAVAFSTDGQRLVYQHPGFGDREALAICGTRVLGGGLVAARLRGRGCDLVRAGTPVDDESPVPLLRFPPSDVEVTQLSRADARAFGVVGSAPRPMADAGCVAVEGEAVALGDTRSRRSRSGDHLAFFRPAGTAPHSYVVTLADLRSGVFAPIGRVDDASTIELVAVGGAERFIMAVRSQTDATTSLFDIDATTGAIRRLGQAYPGVGAVVVSPDGRQMAFSTGPSAPGPPPRPQPRMEPGLRDRHQMPGCDPMPQMPGQCGWVSDGCGGDYYAGDCPDLVQARARAVRSSSLLLVPVPPL